jgi:hypothetical protein
MNKVEAKTAKLGHLPVSDHQIPLLQGLRSGKRSQLTSKHRNTYSHQAMDHSPCRSHLSSGGRRYLSAKLGNRGAFAFAGAILAVRAGKMANGLGVVALGAPEGVRRPVKRVALRIAGTSSCVCRCHAGKQYKTPTHHSSRLPPWPCACAAIAMELLPTQNTHPNLVDNQIVPLRRKLRPHSTLWL